MTVQPGVTEPTDEPADELESAEMPVALSSLFNELAFNMTIRDDGTLDGIARLSPAMLAPDATIPRISVIASWADYTLGCLSVSALSPRMPVTLELDVHVFDGAAGLDGLTWHAYVAKSGRTVTATSMDFHAPDGQRIGFAHGLFLALPADKAAEPPSQEMLAMQFAKPRTLLQVPFAERVGVERLAPGAAVLPLHNAILNTSYALQGGLMTAVIEEAALSADDDHGAVESLHVRYLRGIRVGPARARANVQQGVGHVEVYDDSNGELAVLATTRAAHR